MSSTLNPADPSVRRRMKVATDRQWRMASAALAIAAQFATDLDLPTDVNELRWFAAYLEKDLEDPATIVEDPS